MTVLYDSDIFCNQRFGGISRYFVQLINHLPPEWNFRLPARISDNAYISSLLRRIPAADHRFITVGKPYRHFLNCRFIPDHRKFAHLVNDALDRHAAAASDYDIFHPTGFIPWFIERIKTPYVVTVHDMIHHKLLPDGKPDLMARRIDRTVLNAKRIIAISHATKHDILDYYDIPEERIDVVYHGFTPFPKLSKPDQPDKERFILFVGQRGGYKNFDRFVEAFSILHRNDPELRLVCTGRQFNRHESELLARYGVAGCARAEFVDSNRLNELYSRAACFVFPSKLEGFGMPVLEAFATGCPVALSNASCLPEIAGKGALYFDPDDPDSMSAAISALLYDQQTRRQILAAAEKRLKDFSWEKTAGETAGVYRKALI